MTRRIYILWLGLACSCANVLGEYEVEQDDATSTSSASSTSSGSGLPPECVTDTDCSASDKCAEWGACEERCLDDDDCGSPYRNCEYDNYCSKTAGEPCSSSSECWGDCTNLNSSATELPEKYCAAYCDFVCGGGDCVHVCPSGMVCADEIRCYKP